MTVKSQVWRVPVFPLADFVLFPRVQAPLHIFEDRYSRMLEDVLDEEGRFCMATVDDATPIASEAMPDFHRVGCLCEVSDYSRLDDGRYNILVTGVSRVEMSEVISDHPYRQVDARAICVAGLQDVSSEDKHVLRIHSEQLVRNDLEPFAVSRDYLRGLDLESLLDTMAFYANLPVEERQHLLETTAMDVLAAELVRVYDE